MRTSPKIILVFTILCLSIWMAESAFACRVRNIKSPHELVSKADLIIHIKVPNKDVERGLQPGIPEIQMDVLEVIKGSYSKETIWLRGHTDNYEGPNEHEVPYEMVRPGGAPRELLRPGLQEKWRVSTHHE